MYKNRKRIKIGYRKERVILGDILPYEIPLFFLNDNFYKYLIKRNYISNEPDFVKDILNWTDNKKNNFTIPYNYKITHKENDFRTLSIIHPSNQIKVIDFYDKYKDLIIYYSNISKFSIRKPIKVTNIEFFNDNIHKELFKEIKKGEVEQYDKEYKSYSNFFIYKNYNNIYEFFEDYKFLEAEKKFNKLATLDITKCFQSIYTHTIPWSIINKNFIKSNIDKGDFGSEFDQLMQKMNYNETNGIVIGPEFSRICAEIILQRIDKELFLKLKVEPNNLKLKKDYQIFRYVDDYFIFFNKDEDLNKIEKELKYCLLDYNLHINNTKRKIYEKPIITEISIAKEKIKYLFDEDKLYKIKILNENTGEEFFQNKANSKNIINEFKIIVKESGVKYNDILNYFLVVIEKNLNQTIKKYIGLNEISKSDKSKENFINFLINILDIIFFFYSTSPKVSFTIKVTIIINIILGIFKKKKKEIIKLTITDIDLIKKRIFDGILQILDKHNNENFKEIDSIYLLNILQALGDNYLLDKEKFVFLFKKFYGENLTYFSIISILYYIGSNDKKYIDVKKELLKNIIKKFNNEQEYINQKTELVLLMFDLINCSYLELDFKIKIINNFPGIKKIRNEEKQEIIDYIIKNNLSFTNWKSKNKLEHIIKKKKINVY